MKKFAAACTAFVILLTLIVIHSFSMVRLGKDIGKLSDITEEYADNKEWDKVVLCLKEINEVWEKKSIWTALTIRTDEIEQIEISLKQSEKYAHLKAKRDFFGEFIMFRKLVEHIPHQEGFHIEEIL